MLGNSSGNADYSKFEIHTFYGYVFVDQFYCYVGVRQFSDDIAE